MKEYVKVMNNCIFCGVEINDVNESIEHIIPEALGNRQLSIKEVCKQCNSKLGEKVDSELTSNILIEMIRHIHKIEGKSGKVPNPFNNGVLADDNNQKVRVLFDDQGKSYPVLITNKHERKHEDNTEIHFVFDKSEQSKIPDVINTFLKRKGLPPLSTEEIEKRYKEVSQHIETKHTFRFDVNSYKKAILKIIYESAYYFLGESILQSEEMQILNKAIWDFSVDWAETCKDSVKGTITFYNDDNPFIQLFNLLSKQSDHLILLLPTEDSLNVIVKIFDVFWGVINISSNPFVYSIPELDCIIVDSLSGKHVLYNFRDLLMSRSNENNFYESIDMNT